jgi:hypothetical protein
MRKIIIVIIVVIVVIFSIIGIIFIGPVFGSEEPEEPPLIAEIGADRIKVRLGEGFNFTGENSSGNIVQYSWSFGDGNGSTGDKVYHYYNKPGWYNVTLTIQSSSGQSANATIVVGTQMRDISLDRYDDRHWDLRPQWRSGIGFMNEIGPNIGQPVIDFSGEVQQPIGSFDLVIDVWIEVETNHIQIQDIYTETFYGTGQTFQFSHTVSPGDLPVEVQSFPTQIRTSIWVDQGRWGSAEIHFDAVFPL